MPSQHFPDQTIVPEFKQLVLYTGNVMLTSTTATAGKHWNKKSNTEVGYILGGGEIDFSFFFFFCFDSHVCMSLCSWFKLSLTHSISL